MLKLERKDEADMVTRTYGEEPRTTCIYIDCYDNGNLAGRFFNLYEGVIHTFSSLIDMLEKMDTMLNDIGYPPSFNSFRSFGRISNEEPEPQEDHIQAGRYIEPGKVASFTVKVLFRQNNSWQGIVRCREKRKEIPFRSVLELLFLMDSACRAKSSGKKTRKPK